ncbi:MAG: preprotein translocase subunit SecE [Clostridia bacterium]|nr:preprotein translocase subunit SecE [Clostridia bacterium]
MSKKKTTNVNEAEVKPVEQENVQTEVAAVNVDDTKNNAPKAKGKKTPSRAEQGKKKESFFKRLGRWFRGLFSELKKVTWPTPKDVAKNTSVVVVVVLVFFVLLFAIDYVLAGLLSLLVNGQWATLFI